MPVNDFLPFACGAGANVESQASYASDPSTPSGFAAGIAQSQKLNKVWRQASFVSAAIAGFVSAALNEDVLDNGDLPGFTSQLQRALNTVYPRQVLLGNTNFYVNSASGSDTVGDGLTPGTAWMTLQHAVLYCLESVDCNGYGITIQVANGTYNGFVINGVPAGATPTVPISIVGNISTPAACILSAPPSNVPAIPAGPLAGAHTVTGLFGANFDIQGFRITNTGGTGACIGAGWWSQVRYANCDFGPISGNVYPHIMADLWSRIRCLGNYTISGNAVAHIQLADHSHCWVGNNTPGVPNIITVAGTPAFPNGFLVATSTSHAYVDKITTFSGGATGPRFSVNWHSTINTNGAGATFFPGSLAGVTDAATFGIYL